MISEILIKFAYFCRKSSVFFRLGFNKFRYYSNSS